MIPNNNSKMDKLGRDKEEPPPILKTWKNFYLLVLGNLLFWIVLFTFFTWLFK